MSDACRALSLAAGEPLAGTGLEQITRWILLELPPPWAPEPLESPGIDPQARAHLSTALTAPGTRLQLIRRTGDPGAGHRLFVVRSGVPRGWVHRFSLPSLDGLETVDFAAAWAEPSPSSDPPIVLVCGHGRRDACCARMGVPVFQALAALRPDRVWQTTHLGGHRFAATAVVLPWGLHLGRVAPEEAAGIWAGIDAGEVHRLDRIRGRTDLPRLAQAAAIHLRQTEGLLSVDALVHLGSRDLPDGGTEERFQLPSGEATVAVSVEEMGTPRPRSCGAEVLSRPSMLRCRRIDP